VEEEEGRKEGRRRKASCLWDYLRPGVSDVNCQFLRPVGGSQIWRSATLLAEALWASHRVEACSWEVTTVLGLPP
jgi:hypothetical protein